MIFFLMVRLSLMMIILNFSMISQFYLMFLVHILIILLLLILQHKMLLHLSKNQIEFLLLQRNLMIMLLLILNLLLLIIRKSLMFPLMLSCHLSVMLTWLLWIRFYLFMSLVLISKLNLIQNGFKLWKLNYWL